MTKVTANDARASSDDAVRDLVIATADSLYNLRGIQSVGMDALRDESGVSLKRLYKLFPSKEVIVEEVLRSRHERWMSSVSAAVAEASGPRQQLLAIFDFLSAWFGENDFRGCGFINSFGELGGTVESLAGIVRDHKADFQAYVARLVEQAGGPAWLGPQLAILAEGAQTTAAIAGTSQAADDARRAAEILMDAAGITE
ncbi:TetR family transcriptional regulator [Aeromicrobium sp. Root344]|uniref:TetR/AcrR family transcriptional regulator n=1 Tax=Aeromicrobium sp. Root344 TaxID=1736521 RepID=UPI0006F1F4D0|nr:TetR/AcrR family transcriptional regulator [Aeromicrobium sp. Root344]KQV75603.1 TetR family transcriptional regulator [Aeromicrobium sp. Root344]